jgi:hypothetical protein
MFRRYTMKTGALVLAAMSGIASVVAAGSLPFAHWGLIDTPTANILQHTQIALGGSFTAYSFETADSSSESDFALAGHLDVGLFNRAQIGVTWLGAAGLSGEASFLVLHEDISTPSIVIGCENITGEKNYEFFADSLDSLYDYDESQNFSAYVVFTKNLQYLTGVPVTLDLGYGIGRFRQAEDADSDGISNPFPGLFGALEIHPSLDFNIAIEWDGRDANLGVSYRLNNHVRFMAAVTEFEQLTRGDERQPSDVMQNVKFGLGVELTFGPFLNRTTLEPFRELDPENDQALMDELEAIRSNAAADIQELEETIP